MPHNTADLRIHPNIGMRSGHHADAAAENRAQGRWRIAMNIARLPELLGRVGRDEQQG
jgi:hypothetical protein